MRDDSSPAAECSPRVGAMTEVTIKVRANGPLKVTGPVTIVDAEGVPFELRPGARRALPLRALEEQAVLRRDPPRDRVRGRRHRSARG